MLRNFWVKTVLGIIIYIVTTTLYAETQPKFDIIPITQTKWNLPVNGAITVIYRITNKTIVTRTLTMKPISGITQSTNGTGYCGNPFKLAHGQSCLLVLPITGSQISGGAIIGGPVICKTNGPRDNTPDPFLCSQPSAANSLDITSVGFQLATLSVSPTPLELVILGYSRSVTVTNLSTTVTALNVATQLPSSWVGVVGLTSNGCTSISPGGACILTFTPGAIMPSPSTQSFIAVGSNTTPASFVVSVSKISQSISFTSTPTPPVEVNDTYHPTAIATSGLPVTITVDANSSSVCSITGAPTSTYTVTFISVGTCILDANQGGDGTYNAAKEVQQSITVGKIPQTITFSSPPSNPKVGDTDAIYATASSGLTPVTLTVAPSSASICTLSGSTSPSSVTFLAVGNCIINANQAGNGIYNAATNSETIGVGKASQTISFSTPPTHATVGGSTYSITATASSGLPVDLIVDPTSASICTLSGSTSPSTVSFIGAGTCKLIATQAGNDQYSPVTNSQSFTVFKGDQTITFTSPPPRTWGGRRHI